MTKQKIKILTNIRFAQTAGIAQVVFAFMKFIAVGKSKNIEIVAVNIINSKKETYRKVTKQNTSTISVGIKVPKIAKVIDKAKTLSYVEKKYEKIIQSYQKAIQKEKPNVVLINGTYFMPWCLLVASEREGIPAVLHYHGVLAKETQTWKKHQRKIFLEMERRFDKENIFYIFPSEITKNIVENEVFCHKVKRYSVLPNPVLDHFFANPIGYSDKIETKNIGIVSRWTRVKNVHFCEKLAKYNHKKGGKFSINIITDLDTKKRNYKNLAKIVKFHKPTKNNKKLASFYRNMGVVISPSHFETYGNVAKEALASGTPAIVNSNMGVSETFNKLGLADWIIDFKSVKLVYNKIENIIGGKVSNEVRKEIKDNYKPCKIFNEIVSILGNAVLPLEIKN